MQENKATSPLDLNIFLEEICNSNIGLLTKENFKNLERPLIVAFHAFKEHAQKLRKWIDLLIELSLKYKTIKFFIADVEDIHLFHHDPKRFYFSENDGIERVPSIYAVDTFERQFKYMGVVKKSLKEYPRSRQIKLKGTQSETLLQFCKRLLQDKLFFSEPIPVKQSSAISAVHTVVAYNFQTTIEDTEKDVLIIFYTEWCRVSRMLLPMLDKLSTLLRDDAENLAIVKFNPQHNYLAFKYHLPEYPTITYISRKDKENPVIYRHRSDAEKLSIENLIRFIAQNATFELRNYDRNGGIRLKKAQNMTGDSTVFSRKAD